MENIGKSNNKFQDFIKTQMNIVSLLMNPLQKKL